MSKKHEKLRAVCSIKQEFIPLKHIESISLDAEIVDEAERLIGALKDDQVARITTLSGNTHLISMRHHMELIDDNVNTPDEMWQLIFNNWIDKVS